MDSTDRLPEPLSVPGPVTDISHLGVQARNFAVTRMGWVLKETRAAVCYRYEAGEFPPHTSELVEKYLEPDMGALKSLDLIQKVLELASSGRSVPSLAIFQVISDAFGVNIDLTPTNSE